MSEFMTELRVFIEDTKKINKIHRMLDKYVTTNFQEIDYEKFGVSNADSFHDIYVRRGNEFEIRGVAKGKKCLNLSIVGGTHSWDVVTEISGFFNHCGASMIAEATMDDQTFTIKLGVTQNDLESIYETDTGGDSDKKVHKAWEQGKAVDLAIKMLKDKSPDILKPASNSFIDGLFSGSINVFVNKENKMTLDFLDEITKICANHGWSIRFFFDHYQDDGMEIVNKEGLDREFKISCLGVTHESGINLSEFDRLGQIEERGLLDKVCLLWIETDGNYNVLTEWEGLEDLDEKIHKSLWGHSQLFYDISSRPRHCHTLHKEGERGELITIDGFSIELGDSLVGVMGQIIAYAAGNVMYIQNSNEFILIDRSD